MENFVLILVFVGLGGLFRRFKAFPGQTAQVLNMFALHVALPAVILLKVPQIQFASSLVVRYETDSVRLSIIFEGAEGSSREDAASDWLEKGTG